MQADVIARIVEAVDVPCQVAGGIRDADAVAAGLHAGADRVVLGIGPHQQAAAGQDADRALRARPHRGRARRPRWTGARRRLGGGCARRRGHRPGADSWPSSGRALVRGHRHRPRRPDERSRPRPARGRARGRAGCSHHRLGRRQQPGRHPRTGGTAASMPPSPVGPSTKAPSRSPRPWRQPRADLRARAQPRPPGVRCLVVAAMAQAAEAARWNYSGIGCCSKKSQIISVASISMVTGPRKETHSCCAELPGHVCPSPSVTTSSTSAPGGHGQANRSTPSAIAVETGPGSQPLRRPMLSTRSRSRCLNSASFRSVGGEGREHGDSHRQEWADD